MQAGDILPRAHGLVLIPVADESPLARTEALYGPETLRRLRALHVAVYGVGGVGGWCAEALARSGIGRLTLVDDDIVKPSNLNRQCCATVAALGQPKVAAMKARLLAVAPGLVVDARAERYAPGDPVVPCDVVVDAIDSVDAKCALVLAAAGGGIPVISSLGAAKRRDPSKVTMARFSKVAGDALARAMRQRFKRLGAFPPKDYLCAVSTERPADILALGSAMPVVATFGLVLAARILASESS